MNAVLNVTISTAMAAAICGQALCGEILCGQGRMGAMASDLLSAVLTPVTGLLGSITPGIGIQATITQGPMITADCPDYEGSYEIRPEIHAQILPTENLRMKQDLTVLEIPYAEVSNTSGGTTVTIG